MSSCVTSTVSWSFVLGFSQTRTHTLPPHAATRSTRQFLPSGSPWRKQMLITIACKRLLLVCGRSDGLLASSRTWTPSLMLLSVLRLLLRCYPSTRNTKANPQRNAMQPGMHYRVDRRYFLALMIALVGTWI